MKRQLLMVAGAVLGALLAGCQSPQVVGSAPLVEAVQVATVSLADFRKEVDELPGDANAIRLAAQLERFDSARIDADWQRKDAAELVYRLAQRLRAAVQTEAKALHEEALQAPTYLGGSEKARQASEIIALYPLSDDAESLKEAALLAQTQGAVITQLGLIRRKHYNLWALGQLQSAQRLIDASPYPSMTIWEREVKKQRWASAHSDASDLMKVIEPTLLEPAVAPLYGDLLSQLGKDKPEHRNALLKRIVDPKVIRKTLVDTF